MNDKTRTAHSDRLQRRATLGGYPWIAHVARSSYSALSLESLAKFHRKRHTRTRWGAASRFSLRSKVPFEDSLLRCYDSRTLCGLACAPRTSLTPGCPVEKPAVSDAATGYGSFNLLSRRSSHFELQVETPQATFSRTRIIWSY